MLDLHSSRQRILLPIFVLSCAIMTGSVVASPGGVVVTSSDEKWLLISAKDRDKVFAELDQAAERGYRFVAMSWKSHEFGMSGLNCLLQREEGPPRHYRFVGGGSATSPKKMRNEANEHARKGFRVLPATFQYRSMWWFQPGGVPFLIMESSSQPELLEYDTATAMSPDGFAGKLREHCEEGFRLTAVLSGGSYWMMILERSVESGETGDRTVCELGHLEIIDAMKRKNLRKKLLESTSRGYRILAMTDRGFRGGSLGGILLEKLPDGDRRYEYRVPGVADNTVYDLLTEFNEAGAEGFRLHWAVAPWWFPVLEKPPSSDARYEYRIASGSTAAEMLDAVSAATDEGYRVILLMDDFGALLERADSRRPVPAPGVR